MEWLKFPLVKVTTVFSLGILIAFFNLVNLQISTISAVSSFFIFLLLHVFYKNPSIKFLKGISLTFFIFFSGSVILFIHHPDHQTDHIKFNKFTNYTATVASAGSPYSKGKKITLEIEYVLINNTWKRVTGKVLAYLKTNERIPIGTKILVHGTPSINLPNRNPMAFDYAFYLLTKSITHTHFINPEDFKILEGPKYFSVKQFAADISFWYEGIITKHIKGSNEKGLVIGLVLGSKTYLDPELKKSYENTGLAHILAVSGAHVAIFYQILCWMLSFIKNHKWGNIIFPLLAISFLILYAVITGLTPPVVRATTMFVVILIGKSFQKLLPPLHTLFLSAFLILLFDPFSLFDVGFQLSVVAVLSIVLFYPPIFNYIKFSTSILKASWEIIALTIAAQILTLPLIIYYFHNFPVYFIPANLVSALPSTLIIYFSLPLIITSHIPYLGEANGWLIEYTCRLLNSSVTYIASLPSPFEFGIYLNNLQMILFSISLILVLFGIYSKIIRYIYFSGILLSVLVMSLCGDNLKFTNQDSLIVFHIPKHTIAAHIKGRKAIVFSDLALDQNNKDFTFNCQNYLYSRGINSIEFNILKKPTIVQTGVQKLLITKDVIFDSLETNTLILFCGLNRKNLLELDKNAQLNVILDGSSKEESIKKLNLRTVNTWNSGAFIKEF